MRLALLALAVVSQVTPSLSLNTEVTDSSVAPLIAVFQEAAKKHTPALTLQVNSPGGLKSAGYDLIDAMLAAEAAGTQVTCVVQEADSMAALMVEGACSRRVMHRKGQLLFHETAYDFLISTAKHRLTKEKLRSLLATLEQEDARDAALVAPHMHMTPAEYAAWVADQDRTVDAATALAKGWVDEVID